MRSEARRPREPGSQPTLAEIESRSAVVSSSLASESLTLREIALTEDAIVMTLCPMPKRDAGLFPWSGLGLGPSVWVVERERAMAAALTAGGLPPAHHHTLRTH